MYIKLIEEIEKRIDLAILEDKYNVVAELEDLLKWVKANC